ncbi:MAG: hypothetical protein OQL19_05630 [Gammaproteobacteria bacterium]|nr:hypothetical protein [Gammaproteobacteria bacterium]
MNTKGLSLNTIPPIFVPLRFFITAPIFGIFAALFVLFYGPDIWTSRWLSSSLVLTHLLTLGFMMMVMIGALYQFIPVMIGQYIPGGRKLVFIIHSLLVLGSLSLTLGFIFQYELFYWSALIFLCVSLSSFALSLILLLKAKFNGHLIAYIIRILIFVLVIALGLGLFMLLAYAFPDLGVVYRQYTDTHALWALIGWVVLLIMAVSSQVIPMFFVTPEFSVRTLKILSLMIIITLCGLSLMQLLKGDECFWYREIFNLFLSIELIFFSIYTLLLINQRKRKLMDVTINFFRISLASLLFVILIWWSFHLWSNTYLENYYIQIEFTMGILLIYGMAISAIIGMLQKIVPFLIYLNLQQLSFKHPESMSAKPNLVPNMKQVISTQESKIQFYLHVSSSILLLISIFWIQLIWLAGLLMLLNFIWLFYIVLKGLFLFLNNKKNILSYPEMKMDFGM